MLCKFAQEDQTRDYLANHLMSSPYHNMDEEEAKQHATAAYIEEWEEEPSTEVKEEGVEHDPEQDFEDGEEELEHDEQGPAKFARKGKGKGKSKGKPKGKGKSKGTKGGMLMTKEDIASAVAAGVQQGVAQMQGSTSSSSSAIVPARSAGGGLNKSKLQDAIQHIERAEAASKQAARMCQAAIQAFEAEGRNFNQARIALATILTEL